MKKAESKQPVKKVTKLKVSEGEKLVLDYLNKQNRPYNQKMIFENLHGKDIGLSEATVKSICATLAENGQISTKSFNNKPLYWAKQDRHEELNEEQLKELDLELKALKEKDEDLKAQCAELKRQNDILSSEPTDADLQSILAETEKQNARLRERLEKFKKAGAKAVDPNEAKKIEVKYEFAKKEWRDRKRKFIEICDVFEENGTLDQKKLKKLYEKIGIETDEQYNVSLSNSKSAKFLQTSKK